MEAIPRFLQSSEDLFVRKCLEQERTRCLTMIAGKGEMWGRLSVNFAYQFSGYRCICYKLEILSAVLESTSSTMIDLLKLRANTVEKYGEEVDVDEFFTVCALVIRYIKEASILSQVTTLAKKSAGLLELEGSL